MSIVILIRLVTVIFSVNPIYFYINVYKVRGTILGCILTMTYGWYVIIAFQNTRNFGKRLKNNGDRSSLVEVSVKKWCFFETFVFCIGNPIVKSMDFDDYQ